MSIEPILTFKAGRFLVDESGLQRKVKADPTPGYIYLYEDDDSILHFCWRPRSAPVSDPEDDRWMISDPSDPDTFLRFTASDSSSKSPTNGRVFVLRLSSSKEKLLFWLQSKTQHPEGDPTWFSPRDQKLGDIVNRLVKGDRDINVQAELRNVGNDQDPDQQGGDDEAMEDVEGTDHSTNRPRAASGGAGAGATGGDVREEGEESREGGADGGRAATTGLSPDISALIQNFSNSVSKNLVPGGSSHSQANYLFTTLPDLLSPAVTISVIDSADDSFIESLASHLPPTLLLADDADHAGDPNPTSEAAQAAIAALSPGRKREILRRVLRSAQFHQSLAITDSGIKNGGLPTVSEQLKINVENKGYRGQMPLGGGEALETFLKGVKKTVEEEEKDGKMETD